MIEEIKNSDFTDVLNSKLAVVDFSAVWCGPCQMLAPVVDAIAESRPDIRVGKVNVDEQVELALQYGVRSIPTLIVMKNGEVAATSIGYQSQAEIEAML